MYSAFRCFVAQSSSQYLFYNVATNKGFKHNNDFMVRVKTSNIQIDKQSRKSDALRWKNKVVYYNIGSSTMYKKLSFWLNAQLRSFSIYNFKVNIRSSLFNIKHKWYLISITVLIWRSSFQIRKKHARVFK